MTITQKDIEAILGECVGEDEHLMGTLGDEQYLIDLGRNQALADIRNRIPETARKVLERVREEVEKKRWSKEWEGGLCGEEGRMHNEAIDELIASLTGEVEYQKQSYTYVTENEDETEIGGTIVGEDEGDNGKDHD